MAQGVVRHHALEQAVVLDLVEQILAQLLATFGRAPDAAQVEIDGAAEQVFRRRLTDKGAEAAAPFLPRQAQLRIAGHDVALAQGEAAGVEVTVDTLGQRQRATADVRGLGGIGGLEENAVVLVGVQGLLLAPFAAEAQPGERHAWIAHMRDGQFDDPTHRVIVEQGDDAGDLRRRGTVGQHVVDQLLDAGADDHQGVDAIGMADGLGQMHEVHALQGKQVALGDHTAQQAVVHHADMSDMPLGHGDGRIERGGVRRQVERIVGHELGDRLTQVRGARTDGSSQVSQGKDALRMQRFVDDDDAADVLLLHHRHRFVERAGRQAGDGMMQGQLADAGFQRSSRRGSPPRASAPAD